MEAGHKSVPQARWADPRERLFGLTLDLGQRPHWPLLDWPRDSEPEIQASLPLSLSSYWVDLNENVRSLLSTARALESISQWFIDGSRDPWPLSCRFLIAYFFFLAHPENRSIYKYFTREPAFYNGGIVEIGRVLWCVFMVYGVFEFCRFGVDEEFMKFLW